MVNSVILVGRAGRDPEMRYFESGRVKTTFSLAVNRPTKEKETDWFTVKVWGKQAESLQEYLTKGKQIYVEGRLQTRQWDDKDGNKKYTTEIKADRITLLGGGAGGGRSMDRSGGQGAPMDESQMEPITDDDIPF